MNSYLAYDEEAHEAAIREDAYEDGLEQGIEQGLERGVEQGIKIFIEDKREDGVSEGIIKERLINRFKLDPMSADGYLKGV